VKLLHLLGEMRAAEGGGGKVSLSFNPCHADRVLGWNVLFIIPDD